MKYAVYRVSGEREYRGHAPGTTFPARLDPGAEQRAVNRGDIVLLEHVEPDLPRGSYTLPRGWTDQPEAPKPGASFIEEES